MFVDPPGSDLSHSQGDEIDPTRHICRDTSQHLPEGSTLTGRASIMRPALATILARTTQSRQS
ncbi:hypothetical protein CGCSCA1_v004861 [Colletotrichum siamense]|uniref:uncharacterized protein n=1 Tax=Colletotrichum siamense TaxID=690259 RepID=UPI001872D261|nr:uncharacterized protein CGCS363_v005207 [Colletotrichum siamense]KAF4876181.1 hypothetical protein CGCSCA1_v004861 [Colletotrichum siamense]KAF5506508.1 hypothetical protein CGCS363_v005207 [Colletotrichum siamense]